MRKNRHRIIAVLLSLVLYWCVSRQIPSLLVSSPFLVRYLWQYQVLLGLCAFLALLGAFGDAGFSRMAILLRLPLIFLICYTTGADPVIPSLLVLAIIQETGFRQDAAWGGGIIVSTIIITVSTVIPDRLVFGVPIAGMGGVPLLAFVSLTAPAILLAQFLRAAMDKERRWHESVDRLDLAVSKLAEANLGYQGYVEEVRGSSIADERRRISREIHDTVGYSLTNIRVMLEAATLRMDTNPGETRGLIDQSINEAGLCLDQTRMAMRQLRGRVVRIASGLPAIQRLVTTFSDISGIHVEAEYGNASAIWPMPVERAIYRLVQEGMTNAFRHGMATEIKIYLWQDDKALRLVVRDNGSGSGEFKEGLGITGMRERVEALGGDVRVGPRPDGFEVRARLPLRTDEEEFPDAHTRSSR